MIIIGYGSDIIDRPTFYEDLDENARFNEDRNGEPCDIIVFEKFDTMPNIIEIFDKELSSWLSDDVARQLALSELYSFAFSDIKSAWLTTVKSTSNSYV